MGQHKYNPIAIAFRNGEIPKKKKHLSKREAEKIMSVHHREDAHNHMTGAYDKMDRSM